MLSMNESDFLEQFSDINLDSMEYITIKTLPEVGHLEYQNALVEIDDQITTDLISNLNFVSDNNWVGNTFFTYIANDSSINHISSNEGTVNINIKDGSMIGDGSIDLNEDEVLNLNIAIFNNNYNNISIPIKQIKITSLPDENIGKFVWNYFGDQTDVGIDSIITPENINDVFFVPTENATGVTSFNWMMTDNEDAESNTATMSVTVSPVNDAPVTTEMDKVCLSNGETTFNFEDFKSVYFDVEESELVKIKISRLPNDGTLILNGSDVIVDQIIESSAINNLIFSANSLYDKIIDFGWKASDGELYSTEADIHIVFNDPPACLNFTTQVNEDDVYSFTLDDFEDCFIDPDHDQLQAILFSEVDDGTISLRTSVGGIITLDEIVLGQEIPITNIPNLVYVPVPNDNGLVTFKWYGSEGCYISNESTGIFDIIPVNDIPILSDIHKISAKDDDIIITTTDIMNHFYDADNDVLVDIKIKFLPNCGNILYNNQPVIIDQVISIKEFFNLNYVQTNPSVTNDSISYQASDGTWYSLPANIFFETNTVPKISTISMKTIENTILNFDNSDFINVFEDIDSNPLVKIKFNSLPEHGTLFYDNDIEQTIINIGQEIYSPIINQVIFKPDIDWSGITTFNYQASNGDNYSNTSTIIITVGGTVDDAHLSSLTISEGAISFDKDITEYYVNVGNDTHTIEISAMPLDDKALVLIDGSVTTSRAITVEVGENPIDIMVVAQDASTKTYTVTVNRGISDVNLSDITLSEGILSPTFNTSTTMYTATVSYDTEVITISPILMDSNAKVTVNGGDTSQAVNLDVGENTIDIVVTGKDSVSTKTYILIIKRKEALTINNETLPIGIVGGSYEETLSAEGGILPYTWTATGLPTELTLSETTGEITGTFVSEGNYTIEVKVTDDNAIEISKSLTLNVNLGCGNGGYIIQPDEDSTYTSGYTEDGIPMMTVNEDVEGFKYFSVLITPVTGHSGNEVCVFVHMRNGQQIGLSYIKGDLDIVNGAGAAFNVKEGDTIKAFIVDDLTNDSDSNPEVL
jgi:hypothetical protein